MPCECVYHRYHAVHVSQGKVYDHSQGTWDSVLRYRDDVETYPSEVYRHGMTASDLRKAAELKEAGANRRENRADPSLPGRQERVPRSENGSYSDCGGS